jgi:hypothetical protein
VRSRVEMKRTVATKRGKPMRMLAAQLAPHRRLLPPIPTPLMWRGRVACSQAALRCANGVAWA